MPIRIETETPTEFAAIRTLLIGAFGGSDEADLVDDLRRSGDVVVALTAADDAGVAGHVVFSNLTAEIGGRTIKGVALAPVAVRPDCRNRGLAARLMTSGLEQCASLGHDVAVVLGDPQYYSRFGFSVERAAGLQCAFSGPYLQVLELRRGALGSGKGMLIYAAAFSRFS